MFPILYLPNEPEHFLGFLISWIRIRIQEAYLYADPNPKHCGQNMTLFFTLIRNLNLSF